MSAIRRGVRNTFRNPIRTGAIVLILGISFGLVLVMLAARAAVDRRITEVKASIGNTVTISPAGARGFLGGGEPLTTAQVQSVASVSHVNRVDATIDAQLVTDTDTSLKSAVEPGTLGQRGGRTFRVQIGGQTGSPTGDLTLPISAVGTNNTAAAGPAGSLDTLSAGVMIDPSGDANAAMLGSALAEKNSLTVGSTFKAFKTDITVAGIYDAGNEFANNSAVFPLKTLQRLSDQKDQVTSMTAQVDSVDNVSATAAAIKSKLGDAADVTTSEEAVKNAVSPLANIKTIATTSLWVALTAAGIITLLTMVMIVRERRREIAILKAIGAGDGSLVGQFMSESMVLTLVGSVIGTAIGAAIANPILHALLTSSRDEGPRTISGGGLGAGGIRVAAGGFRAIGGAFQDLSSVVDWRIMLYGLGAALLVALLGSVVPAWLIGKIRPAEVLRSE